MNLTTAGASSVRVTRVGALDPRKRSHDKPIAVETDGRLLESLRDALEILEESLGDEVSLMALGTVDFHFFDGHTFVASVTFIAPSWTRYPPWQFDARLREPERLPLWLQERARATFVATNGWCGGLMPFNAEPLSVSAFRSSYVFWRFIQKSADVPKYFASRRAVSPHTRHLGAS